METNLLPTLTTADSTVDFFKNKQDTYTAHIRDFIKWIGDREINTASIRDYFIYLNQDSPFTPGTIRIKRQAVKRRLKDMAYQLPENERARIRDFLDVMDNTGETKAPGLNNTAIGNDKYIARDEVKKLLMCCRSRRQMAFIRFLAAHGCRINELTGIKLSDVRKIGEIYYIEVRGKGNKYRTLKCRESLYSFVRDTFRGETYLFETGTGKRYNNIYITNQIKKLGKKFLDRSISAHTLRHSFATEAVRRGIPIDAVADYLGHSSPAITLKMYCHNQIADSDLFEMDMDIGGTE